VRNWSKTAQNGDKKRW